LVTDGPHVLPFEKTSGFQKSAINLAMRIVLGKLGVSGMRNTQLFIDEGFTACDTENLENIPHVLDNLLQNYQTIIIVTHLEMLKNSLVYSIDIRRDEEKGSSRIAHGDRVPFWHTVMTAAATRK